MTLIKDDLKASNQFKPHLTFEMNSFGQLNLKGYSSFDSFRSKILTGQQPLELIKLCEFNPNDKFKLLYRASVDGFGSNDFHSKCDWIENTLTIFKVSGTSFLFGGFKFEGQSKDPYNNGYNRFNQFKSDPKSFLFSLTNKDNKPCKMKFNPNGNQYGINSLDQGNGPSFGYDIQISSNSNTTNGSSSNLGYNYIHPQYTAGTNEAQSFLAGSYQFRLSEIEVYQRETDLPLKSKLAKVGYKIWVVLPFFFYSENLSVFF